MGRPVAVTGVRDTSLPRRNGRQIGFPFDGADDVTCTNKCLTDSLLYSRPDVTVVVKIVDVRKPGVFVP